MRKIVKFHYEQMLFKGKEKAYSNDFEIFLK